MSRRGGFCLNQTLKPSREQGKGARILTRLTSHLFFFSSITLIKLICLFMTNRAKVPNAQTRGPLLELLLFTEGWNQAFVRSELVRFQSWRDDVHHHRDAWQRLRLPARRPHRQPHPKGSGPLHSGGISGAGAQLAADTEKCHSVSRRGDDNSVVICLVDPAMLRDGSWWVAIHFIKHFPTVC